MIKFSESDLKYIEENISESIKILELKNPKDIEIYAIEELTNNEYNIINLQELRNNLKFANENKEINKQIEEYCIWIMGMWLHLRFDFEEDELGDIEERYCSIYGKIARDDNGNKRYYGNGIIFYEAD